MDNVMKRRAAVRTAVPALMSIAVLSCGAPKADEVAQDRAVQVNSADSSASRWPEADSIVVIGGNRILLTTSAWRDFMPQVGGDGSGGALTVSLQIQSLDELPLPAGLSVDSVLVHSSEGLWRAAPSIESRPELPNGMDLVLRGGPKWSVGQVIDMQVRLRVPSGEVHYLQRRGQAIGRVD